MRNASPLDFLVSGLAPVLTSLRDLESELLQPRILVDANLGRDQGWEDRNWYQWDISEIC